METLKEQLAAVSQNLAAELPEESQALLRRMVQRLVDDGAGTSAVQVGDYFPRFSLPNAAGDAISSEDLLAKGPLVVCYYRGGWCPYCNLELRAYQGVLPRIRELGAEVVAVSPQLGDESVTMAARSSLTFELLTDTGNSLAEHLGLAFELSDATIDLYRELGFDLERINGTASWTLPIPATFLIGSDSKVILASVNPDYTLRLEPAQVVAALEELAA